MFRPLIIFFTLSSSVLVAVYIVCVYMLCGQMCVYVPAASDLIITIIL